MKGVIKGAIRFFDLFSGIGGFREGLRRAGGFVCVGHCEMDFYADRNYRRLFETEGEWFCHDARDMEPEIMPDFELLCAGFPCQAFSIAGRRAGFQDTRGTLFFEVARLVRAKKPCYVLLENVPGLLSHDKGRTFQIILNTFSKLGYHVEWMVLNSKDFGVPQSRKRVYLIGYLNRQCAGKILPIPKTNGAALMQVYSGKQGARIYHPDGLSCTLTASAGGMGGKTGLYEVGIPIKENTKKGYKMAYQGDSIDLGYATQNTRRGRVGDKIAHTLTTESQQGILTQERKVDNTTKEKAALVVKAAFGNQDVYRIRRLTPRECLRLQGYQEEQISCMLEAMSDRQLYKQAGNGVTVSVIEAIGKNLRRVHEIQ